MSPHEVSRLLRRNGFAGLAIACLLIALYPVLRSVHDLAFMILSPLLVASLLAVLAMSVHLLFDAALFRMIATGADVASGLRDTDLALERMGLRPPQTTLRPLDQRITGSLRIVRRQRFFLVFGLFSALLLVLLPSAAKV